MLPSLVVVWQAPRMSSRLRPATIIPRRLQKMGHGHWRSNTIPPFDPIVSVAREIPTCALHKPGSQRLRLNSTRIIANGCDKMTRMPVTS